MTVTLTSFVIVPLESTISVGFGSPSMITVVSQKIRRKALKSPGSDSGWPTKTPPYASASLSHRIRFWFASTVRSAVWMKDSSRPVIFATVS